MEGVHGADPGAGGLTPPRALPPLLGPPSGAPWWPEPPLPLQAPPPPSHRRFWLILAIAAAALLLLIVGGASALLLQGSDGSPGQVAAPQVPPSTLPSPPAPPSPPPSLSTDATPAMVTAAYYAALERGDAATAYGLLCAAAQNGEPAYAAAVARNAATGTGIKSWTQRGQVQVAVPRAIVPGHLVLSGGLETDIQVLLQKELGRWKVCSSDLGGIIPGPGTGPGPSASAATI